MRKILLIVLALMLMIPHSVHAESLDVASMTDEELKTMHDLLEAEIDRRAAEARAAAALVATEEEGSIVYYREENRTPKIIFSSEEQLKNRLHKVTLTMENWNQYLGDYYYPYVYAPVNNFGEVTQTREYRSVGFHFKEGYIGSYADVGMKFTGKSTYEMEGEWNEEKNHYRFVADKWSESDQAYTFDMYFDGKRDIHLEKYECTGVTGTIYVLEVPPEASQWILASNGSVPWVDIYVGDRHMCDSGGLKQLYERLNQ